ncbi:MAG: hypothetical protein JSS29_01500 [Proteobacteria bacterium]|nr:hypothetical protein [Pseudomonadota bacterium]
MNSLDPAPFWDRDLDPNAALFIEEEFSEMRGARLWHLLVHSSSAEDSHRSSELQAAVNSYYDRMANSMRHRMREEIRVDYVVLLCGAAIFLACMMLRSLVYVAPINPTSRVVDESLIVIAWLALWRPAEALIYGWVPLFRRRRLYRRLAAVRVFVRTDASRNTSATRKPPSGKQPSVKTTRDTSCINPAVQQLETGR